ncbi:glycosyltransferase family 87 protein [Nocardioides okcheonensis]|uniref:glycosyltransferase family 87 protein n=1 Tax=Nocardioides okcheonensis TaxID=2894081 RepID=UPI001E2C5504|nr:glycosyltransferase family 87 protein [Nocardioides okcheonensis]UFN45614.1 DUF2029 domain-containing protein [Nocardioides okcheonensis]
MTTSTPRRLLPLVVAWAWAVVLTWFALLVMADTGPGFDSHAYWRAAQGALDGSIYGVAPGGRDAFNYSPAFVQVLWPLAQLPWPVFATGWALAALAAFTWLLWPLGPRYVVPLVLCCTPEILSGNIFWLMALVVVAAARPGARPGGAAAWALVALTKVTPALGPLWHALRREWRSLAWSVASTLVVVAVSVVASPALWADWLDFLTRHERSTGIVGAAAFGPLVVRLPLALAVLVWGALTDRRWALPAAMALATPVAGPAAFTMLAAVPRLREPTAQPAAASGTQQDQPGAQSTSPSPSVDAARSSGAVPSRVTTRSDDAIARRPPSRPSRKSR